MGRWTLFLLLGGSLLGCQLAAPQAAIESGSLSVLPAPLSNNAAASVHRDGQIFLVSVAGLKAGTTHSDVHAGVYQSTLTNPSWQYVGDLPDGVGRLASAAVGVGDKVFIFGGYSVADNGDEVSTPQVWAYNPQARRFTARASMPIPVDDAVALVYQDRYVYLISGWHDLANVNLVQRYDTQSDSWTQATAFPGEAVFGHAGAILGATMIVCDGVKIDIARTGNRTFATTDACYRGDIDPENSRRIDWHTLPSHPGPARYRMVAAASESLNMIVFAGGTDNPYNYDGIGYDGKPSQPLADLFAYDLSAGRWRSIGNLAVASMDHRALLSIPRDGGDEFVLVGGMRAEQTITDEVVSFWLGKLQ